MIILLVTSFLVGLNYNIIITSIINPSKSIIKSSNRNALENIEATTYSIKVSGNKDWNWNTVYLSEGIAVVRKGDLYGYVDVSGKIISELIYKEAGAYSEGLAAVFTDALKWGCIDTKGRMVVPAKYELIMNFKNGTSHVYTKNKWGAIDTSGKMIVDPWWSGFGDFSKLNNLNESLAPVCTEQLWGYVDRKNEIVISPQFKSATSFYDEVASVQLDENKWAIINTKGKVLRELPVSFIGQFSDGLAIFYSEQEDAYGYIDTKGNIVIKPQFVDCLYGYNDFINGYAVQYDKNNGYQIIDKNGKGVLSTKWDYMGSISEGIVPVIKDNRWGYVNIKLDRVICEPQWDNATIVSNGCAFVQKDGIWNIIEFKN